MIDKQKKDAETQEKVQGDEINKVKSKNTNLQATLSKLEAELAKLEEQEPKKTEDNEWKDLEKVRVNLEDFINILRQNKICIVLIDIKICKILIVVKYNSKIV